MTNEMKLLMAFIEASGFDVEVILDYQERKLTKQEASGYFNPFGFGLKPTRHLECEKCELGQYAYLIDDDGMYTERLTSPNIDYKVTKKPTLQDIVINGISLAQYISNIVDIKHYDEDVRFICYSKEVIDAIISSGFFKEATITDKGYLIEGVRVNYENI